MCFYWAPTILPSNTQHFTLQFVGDPARFYWEAVTGSYWVLLGLTGSCWVHRKFSIYALSLYARVSVDIRGGIALYATRVRQSYCARAFHTSRLPSKWHSGCFYWEFYPVWPSNTHLRRWVLLGVVLPSKSLPRTVSTGHFTQQDPARPSKTQQDPANASQ